MNKIIIITGGIASGKSFLTFEIKKSSQYAVLKSDEIAHKLMKSKNFLLKLNNITQQNICNLKYTIQQSPEILSIIESILYPQIQSIRNLWIKKVLIKKLIPVIEIPLFFEKDINLTLNDYSLNVISTICGRKKQIQRAKKRKISKKLLNIILNRQVSDCYRIDQSDFVVYTYCNKNIVKKQLYNILKKISN